MLGFIGSLLIASVALYISLIRQPKEASNERAFRHAKDQLSILTNLDARLETVGLYDCFGQTEESISVLSEAAKLDNNKIYSDLNHAFKICREEQIKSACEGGQPYDAKDTHFEDNVKKPLNKITESLRKHISQDIIQIRKTIHT